MLSYNSTIPSKLAKLSPPPALLFLVMISFSVTQHIILTLTEVGWLVGWFPGLALCTHQRSILEFCLIHIALSINILRSQVYGWQLPSLNQTQLHFQHSVSLGPPRMPETMKKSVLISSLFFPRHTHTHTSDKVQLTG